jgi:serine/threonine-protein kinase
VADRVARAIEAVRRLVAAESQLSADERARLEEERLDANSVRAAALLPVLAALQLTMLGVYHPRPDGLHAAFRAGIFWIHATTLPATATLSAVAWLGRQRRFRLAWLGDAVLLVAVALGLALSMNTHRFLPNLNGLNIALFSGTLVVRPTRAGAVLAYGGALLGLFLGLAAVQPDAEVRLAHLTSGSAMVLLTFAFSRALDVSFRREVVQRITIARQKSELVAWNAELERRVEQQVREALERADEVRALDAQLRVKVRDRSRELARALRDVSSSEAPLASGSRFEQRFDIEHPLGSGAWGEVYAGRDLASGQRVAVKILRRAEGLGPADANRFVAEAAAAASVVHPAIVRTFHVDITETGRLYLVMELVRGRTLAAELARGTFDAAQTARLGAVVAEALAVAHAAGVVHRDVKPGNLMLAAEAPGVRVLDFGISKLADGEHAGATMTGQMVGTPLYMAPEQIRGDGRVTGACDVYALGQVLYEMLTGAPCFGGKTVRAVLLAQLDDAPVSVRTRAGADLVPDDLAALVAQCLEKAPERRPTADVLAAALRVIADTLSAPPLQEIGPPRHLRASAPEVDVAETVRAGS